MTYRLIADIFITLGYKINIIELKSVLIICFKISGYKIICIKILSNKKIKIVILIIITVILIEIVI